MGQQSTRPAESLLMEQESQGVEVDTRKMSEEVMEGLDKFRYKGKEESDSDSEEDETKAPKSQAWLPDGYSRIFMIVCVWPFGLLDYGSATLRCKI